MTSHLTHEQLCDLLLSSHSRDAWILASPEMDTARDHLLECKACASEFDMLSESMQIFRSTADNWSSQRWNHKSLVQVSALKSAASNFSFGGLLSRPLLWVASASLAIAVAAPFVLHGSNDSSGEKAEETKSGIYAKPAAAISDEALLEEINQTLSSSVPSPMQALADPTGQAQKTLRKN